MRVRLVRGIEAPGRSGPINGQHALQKHLRRQIEQGLQWLSIGGSPREGELAWFWCWLDRADAARWAKRGRPFVQGPNTVFLDSRRPRIDRLECAMLDAPSCRLMFTESEWYRRLILRHRGPANKAPVLLWPYPIDPRPAGPVHPAQHDLLIYVKSRRFPELAQQLRASYSRCCTVYYGQYEREQLWGVARRSRACLYLSDDDRGPLALAEILLCGCPAVGVATGAPFVRQGRTGVLVNRFSLRECVEAIEDCLEFDRHTVAALAAEQFDTDRIIRNVITSLDQARKIDHLGAAGWQATTCW